MLHRFIDRVPCGSGDGGDNRPIFAGERVEQRRLARVRPSDDGDLDLTRFHCRRFPALFRKAGGDAIEQGFHPDGVLGGDRKQIGDAERVELVRQVLALLGIDLVDGEGKRPAELDQHLRQVAIGAGDLGAAIDKENDVVGLLEGAAGLLQDLGGNVIGILDDDSAGVDHLEGAALVDGGALDAVAGDSRLVADDGPALSGDAIE